VYELEGRYCDARETYSSLLVKAENIDLNDGSWAPDPEPSELEQELWEDGLEECMKKAHLWTELKDWYIRKVGDEDVFDHEIWKEENRHMLRLHLSQLIGTCSITAPTKGEKQGMGKQRDQKMAMPK